MTQKPGTGKGIAMLKVLFDTISGKMSGAMKGRFLANLQLGIVLFCAGGAASARCAVAPEPAKDEKKADAAATPDAAKPAAADASKPAAETTPIPRHIVFPPLRFLTSENPSNQNFDARKVRFGVVCVFATWSRQTINVTKALNAKTAEFAKRHVVFAGAFSHDTKEALDLWAKAQKPQFKVGLADDSFVDALKNPKVPSCYVVNSRGEILLHLETPTDKNLKSLFESLTLWTDF